MAQAYFSLVTTLGRNKLAASAAGGPEIVITHFAVGDGNGAETNPIAANTALVREVWRTPIESVVLDPDNPSAVLVTAIIPTTAGGWYMREFGVFDQAGAMIAVAKPVSQYKPTALEGQLEDIRYEFQIIIGETANVTMLVDPSVLLASRDWVSNRRISMGQLMRLPWVPVISMTITAPPTAPSVGDTYAIPAAATGAWAGHAQQLAEWSGTSWTIINAPDGHGISLPDGRVFQKIAGVNVEKLALDAQSGKWSYAVPAGTANAITATLAPVPVSWLSLSGASIHLMISTANTATGVTLNLNGLGAKAVVYNDGTLPQPGDLVGLVELAYNPVLDKVQIMSLSRNATLNVKRSTLVADRGASTQLTATNVTTKVTGYGTVTSYFAGGSTFSAGTLTIGPADAGLWYISGHCRQYFPSSSGMSIYLHVNAGANAVATDGGAGAASGSMSHGSCSRVLVLAAGDTVDMRVLQTTVGDVFFNDLYSLTAVRLGNS